MSCSKVRILWLLSLLGLRTYDVADMALEDWIRHVFFNFSEYAIQTFCICSWLIWSDMNNIVYNNKRREDRFLFSGSIMLSEQLQDSDQKRAQAQLVPSAVWRPPEQGRVKVNTDVAIDLSNELSIGGMVIRDHTGQVCKMGTKMFAGITNVEMAELMAMRFGVEMAIAAGFKKLHIESDALLVIHRVHNIDSAMDHSQLIAENIVDMGHNT